ncbi:MAG: thiamine-phosphate diphosphorylase [Acidobacteria bacterium 13_1_40CM_4_69_4]|nr:MAG: thiamine-phosphate diphosphorylase [Acidobacteria bacterium 13_1_40CM_4_69_4]
MADGWPRYDLYVITDPSLSRGRSHIEVARAALEGGADAIQIRDKSSTAYNLGLVTAEIQPLARKFGAALLVNDRVDVALLAGADGAHLGQDDLPAREARRLLPRPRLIGVSVGTMEEAKRAQRDGADYVGATATKPDAGEPLGLERLAGIVAAVAIPVVAVGGITLDNVAEVFAAGAGGAAAVSAVVSAEDIAGAARALKRRIAEARGSSRVAGAGPRETR